MRLEPAERGDLHARAVFEWSHGRFHAGDEAGAGARAAPVAATALGKLGAGLLYGVISFVTGTLWCTLSVTLFVWLPAKVMRHGATE
ncbi:MAG: hypothetical protein NXI31_12490 [bacterium]|nr:hypothetical protein [bacterium]